MNTGVLERIHGAFEHNGRRRRLIHTLANWRGLTLERWIIRDSVVQRNSFNRANPKETNSYGEAR